MALQDITLDEVGALSGGERLERYKATEGTTDRVAIVLLRAGPNDLTHARILKGAVRFHPTLGSVLDDPTVPEELWSSFEQPRDRAVTLIARYPTDPSGRIIKDRLSAQIRILQWEFGPHTLGVLKVVDDTLRAGGKTVGMVDLRVHCTSGRYQRVEVEPVEPCIWRTNAGYSATLLERVRGLESQLRLGKEMTEPQLRAALGLPLAVAVADDDDVESLLNQI
jgi:hypothetical protein